MFNDFNIGAPRHLDSLSVDSSSKLMGMKTAPILLALGKNVSKFRKEKGLTQEQLAERSGLDSTYISGIERGVRNPSFKSLVSLANGFGISVSEMCNGVKGGGNKS